MGVGAGSDAIALATDIHLAVAVRLIEIVRQMAVENKRRPKAPQYWHDLQRVLTYDVGQYQPGNDAGRSQPCHQLQ